MAQVSETEQKIPFKILLDKTVHHTIKAYAVETDQTMSDVLKEPVNYLEQESIKIANKIEEMKRKSYSEEQKKIEAQKLADQHPLTVSGKKEDPIGKVEVEPRAF